MAIKPEILEVVEDATARIGFGTVTLIVQDGHLIQMDKTEKVRFVPDRGKAQPGLIQKASMEGLRGKIVSSLEGLQYGQVTFVIKDGSIVQIERTEKRRVPVLQGVYGEGI